MSNHAAQSLQRNRDRIVRIWSERALHEVTGAKEIKGLILESSMSAFLEQLSKMFAKKEKSAAQVGQEEILRTQLSKGHGKVRAGSPGYLIQEVIFEYHILRQVIFQVLEEEGPLSSRDRDTIIDGIEKAVNDAATMFSDTLRDIRERLMITLTHDLRTPLTAAKSAAELILRRSDNPEFCTKSAMMISTNMGRLDQMIQDILTASRIQAGEALPLEMTEIDLSEVARRVIDEISLTFPGRVRFEEQGSTRCMGNAGGLTRVIENLIGNALKHGDPGAEVIVTLSGSETDSRIIVHNKGNPIPPEQQSVLFEQYRRTRTAGHSVGWGLGLLLAKGIVEAHEGFIQVESSPKKGTNFTVILPKKALKSNAA